MITVSDAINRWKDADAQRDPIVTLFDIVIHSTLTIYLMQGNPNGKGFLLYDGRTYIAAAIRLEDLEQTLEGDIRPRRLAISNIDGVAGGYLERFDLDGNLVTIRRVLLSNPSTVQGQFFLDEATIQNQFFNRKEAVVELGWARLFSKSAPSKRYTRNKCTHDYPNRFDVENGCNYPSDQFSEDTTQDFVAGGTASAEQERKFGWYTKNALKAVKFNVNLHMPDFLYIETIDPDVEWAGSEKKGPFCYKKITGDFEVYTQVDPQFFRPGSTIGILCEEDVTNGDSFIMVGRLREEGGSLSVAVNVTIDGGVEPSDVVGLSAPSWVKLRRVGDVFSSYYATTENVGWTLISDRTVVMTPEVNLGLALAGGAGNQKLAGQFPYFRFLSGGIPDCDQTRDGANGCSKHKNIHRIFLFGIPKKA